MRGVELRVPGGAQVGEEAVLACGEGDAVDVLRRDRLAVEAYRARVGDVAEYALHKRRLARAVFAEEAHKLAAREGEADVFKGLFVAVAFGDVLYFKHVAPPSA